MSMKQLESAWRQDFEPGLVSVIIPTYNRARAVRHAIHSALAQCWRKVQVIVVNDGSRDDTVALLNGIADIIVIHQANQGVAAARTAGLEAARGEYIASLDSDDVWHPNYLSTLIPLMLRHRCQAGIAAREKRVAGNLVPVRATPVELKYVPSSQPFILLGSEELRSLGMASVLLPNPGVVFHRQVVEPWPAGLRTIDDIGQHMSVLLRHAPRAVLVPAPLWEVSPCGQDEESIVGRNQRADLGWRTYRELGSIENEWRAHLTPGEQRTFARKRADWLSGDSAYPLSLNGRIIPALHAYWVALGTDPTLRRVRDLAAGFARAVKARTPLHAS